MLARLARFAVNHRRVVVATWIVLLLGVAAANRTTDTGFTNDLSLAGSDSQAAYDTLRAAFPASAGDAIQVVIHDERPVDRADVQRAFEAASTRARQVDEVTAVVSPYAPGAEMVSSDRRTALATVQFGERAKDLQPASVEGVVDEFSALRDLGVQVEFGGPALQTESGPSGSEAVGLVAAMLVLLVAFGSVFAMLVPLITALFALGLGMGIIHLLSGSISIGTAGPVVAAMIGLGVGIDYALLVVTRHREGLHSGTDPAESIVIALTTAGRSVLVAGTTVIVAILSLYLIGIPFVSTLGLASAITVAATLAAAVTLLPALLALFGGRLDRLRVRPWRAVGADGGRWGRWARHVQSRPWTYVVLASLLLVAMALPLFSLRLGTADGGSARDGSTESRSYDLVREAFGPGWTGPLVVTAEHGTGGARDVTADAAALRGAIADAPGVAAVTAPRIDEGRSVTVLTVVPDGSPADEATEDLVHRLREDVLPAATDATTHVGGATATAIDLADRLGARLGWFVAFVVGLSFLLLLVEFRSPFIAVKAAAMNLLSVGAAYGAVVAVFQWGWLSDLVGAEPGPIESFAPMMLFAVLFGLSMDYEVFLLSRVREAYLRTGDAASSIATGIASTARVITAAAAVMVVVFSSFLLNDQRVVNLFGFGLAVAIVIDATIVRMVLVPAVMGVAGDRAWWAPARWRAEAHAPTLLPASGPMAVDGPPARG